MVRPELAASFTETVRAADPVEQSLTASALLSAIIERALENEPKSRHGLLPTSRSRDIPTEAGLVSVWAVDRWDYEQTVEALPVHSVGSYRATVALPPSAVGVDSRYDDRFRLGMFHVWQPRAGDENSGVPAAFGPYLSDWDLEHVAPANIVLASARVLADAVLASV